MEPVGAGLAAKLHALPFQCSINGMGDPPPEAYPTAQISFGPAAATSSRWVIAMRGVGLAPAIVYQDAVQEGASPVGLVVPFVDSC